MIQGNIWGCVPHHAATYRDRQTTIAAAYRKAIAGGQRAYAPIASLCGALRRIARSTGRYQNGFDCQGLWVEVEKEHGFASKNEIREYGIDRFVQDCKDRVNKCAKRITDQSIRLGYWMDWDNSYFTMSEENNYTIWSFLKKCHEKGLVYRGHDVMPWSGRSGSAYSQMEVIEGRKYIASLSLFVKYPLIDPGHEGENLGVWTTTPWTLSFARYAFTSRLCVAYAGLIYIRFVYRALPDTPSHPGFSGLAIAEMLLEARKRAIHSTVVIYGIAASAAAIMALAADHVVMTEIGSLMLHGVYQETWDGKIIKKGDDIDRANAVCLSLIQRRCPSYTMDMLLAKDNWYSVAEAKELGLIDEVRPLDDFAKDMDLKNMLSRLLNMATHASKPNGGNKMSKTAKNDLDEKDV